MIRRRNPLGTQHRQKADHPVCIIHAGINTPEPLRLMITHGNSSCWLTGYLHKQTVFGRSVPRDKGRGKIA